MLLRAIASSLLMTVLLAACASQREVSTPRQSASVPNSALSSPAATPLEAVTWRTILGEANLASRWMVAPCEGESPFLCVQSNGEAIGSLELAVYSLEQSGFQAQLAEVGVASGAVPTPDQTIAALRVWANQHYQTIQTDRQSMGTFAADELEVVPVGQLQGLRYGFRVTNPEGQLFERSLGYVTFDGDRLYVITTAAPESDAGGTFKTETDLAQFEPDLATLIAKLKLPR